MVGGLVCAGVGKGEGIGLGGVEGKDEGLELCTVEGSLFGLGDGIFVWQGDKLGNNVGCRLGVEVFGNSVGLGLGMLNGVGSGAEFVVSSAEPGVGGTSKDGNFVR